METLILNDGTELENSNTVESGDLYVYVRNGYGLSRVFALLNDPEKTKKIIDRFRTDIIHEGYTRLIAVRDEGNGLITAVLRKQTQEEVEEDV